MRLPDEYTVAALIPVKWGSLRLRKKNFQKLSNAPDAPALWQATRDILKAHKAIKRIFISCDSVYALNRLTDMNAPGADPNPRLLIEGESFQHMERFVTWNPVTQGKTLGGTLANLVERLEREGDLDFDYLLVPQVDVWPKLHSEIDNMLDYARFNPDVDFVVSGRREASGKGLTQVGAWRLIRLPLNLEPLGQTIGVVTLPGEKIDVHNDEDLIRVQQMYDAIRERQPRKADEQWWVLP